MRIRGKNYNKLFLLKITYFCCFLFFFNFSYAANVDVGSDVVINYDDRDDYNLSATTSGFELCDFTDYMWTENSNTLFIEMPYEKDMAKIYANDIYDNPGIYTIKLTATCNGGNPDDGGFIEEDSFILTINGPASNQTPTDISLDNNNIDENNSIGDVIGNLSTIDSDDPDNLGTYSYTLISESGNQSNSFIVDSNKLKINEIADYETRSSYLIKIRTTDEGGLSYIKEFTISINDIDETIASIDAGSNQNVIIGDTVYLNGSINGFPSSGCDFYYNWFDDTERVSIINFGSLTGASFETNSFTGITELEIGLQVIVSSNEMTHDSCGKTGRYEDNVTINISKEGGNISFGKSYSSRMKEEADYIFITPDKIKLNLYEINPNNQDYYNLRWEGIGGDGQIEYELQYSTGSKFLNYHTYNTKSKFKYFTKYDLEESSIYFFRVKAKYQNKESAWSNIVSITNKNDLLKDFNVGCKECNNKISFQDIFNTIDFLIEDNFYIQCLYCDKKLNFGDIFIYKNANELIDEELKNSFCNKKINYNDILNYKKGIEFKINCSDNFKEINFDNLIK